MQLCNIAALQTCNLHLCNLAALQPYIIVMNIFNHAISNCLNFWLLVLRQLNGVKQYVSFEIGCRLLKSFYLANSPTLDEAYVVDTVIIVTFRMYFTRWSLIINPNDFRLQLVEKTQIVCRELLSGRFLRRCTIALLYRLYSSRRFLLINPNDFRYSLWRKLKLCGEKQPCRVLLSGRFLRRRTNALLYRVYSSRRLSGQLGVCPFQV